VHCAGVPVYVPAFAGNHCTDPWRDGQAELTWVAGYILRWFTSLPTATHPSALINFVNATNDITNYAKPTPLCN